MIETYKILHNVYDHVVIQSLFQKKLFIQEGMI